MKTRLKFDGRGGDGRYYWTATRPAAPNDSRHERVSCNVDWFWVTPIRASKETA